MARLFSPDGVQITIPEAINESNVTIYVIAVKIGLGKTFDFLTLRQSNLLPIHGEHHRLYSYYYTDYFQLFHRIINKYWFRFAFLIAVINAEAS